MSRMTNAAKSNSGSTSTTKSRPPRTERRAGSTVKRILLTLMLLLVGSLVAMAFIPTTRWAYGSGYIITDSEAELRPSVEGVVRQVAVRSGQIVEPGQLIIQLDADVQRASLEQAQTELDASRAELARLQGAHELERNQLAEQTKQAQLNAQLLQDQLDRMTAGQGFAQKEIEETRLRLEVARSRLAELQLPRDPVRQTQIDAARQRVAAHAKHVSKLEAELKLRRITTPVAGTVHLHRFEIGEVVKPEHVLGQVFDRQAWVIKLKVAEQWVGRIDMGQPVKVELEAYPALRFGYFQAEVSRLDNLITPQPTGNGVFYVEAIITPRSDISLEPGMTAVAYVNTGPTTALKKLIGWQ